MVERRSRMENLSVLVLDFDPTSLLAISNTLEKVNFKGEFQFWNLSQISIFQLFSFSMVSALIQERRCVSLDSCVSHLLYDRLLTCCLHRLLDAVDSMWHLLKGHLNKFYSYCYIQLFQVGLKFDAPTVLCTWSYYRIQFPSVFLGIWISKRLIEFPLGSIRFRFSQLLFRILDAPYHDILEIRMYSTTHRFQFPLWIFLVAAY
jgi:hypothetical protein